MSAAGKYRVIAVDTLEERKRHRAVLEESLRKNDLSPALRNELLGELQRRLQKEQDARKMLVEAEQDEAREKEKGDDSSGDGSKDKSGGGVSGSAGSSGSGSGSGSGGDSTSGGMHLGEMDFLFTDVETLALLFFEMETSTPESTPAPMTITTSVTLPVSEAVAAATVSIDHTAGIAHVHEPYVSGAKPNGAATLAVLLSLEQHAQERGAREMRLQAHADAAALLQKKHGYRPKGAVVVRQGIPMQRLAKTLTKPAFTTPIITG